jgi:Ca2+/Na+ antiporter
LHVEYPLMVIFSMALALMMSGTRGRISRVEGGLLFAGFVAFLVMSFLKQ